MYPRSTPTGYVVSPKPTAAMLEYDGVGYRSGINPFAGLPVSQKNRKVRSSQLPEEGIEDLRRLESLSAGGSHFSQERDGHDHHGDERA